MPAPTPVTNVHVVYPVGLLPPTGTPHAYFERLIARPDVWVHRSYRSQAQLDADFAGRGASFHVTYSWPTDPYPQAQDAAKVTIPRTQGSIAQIHTDLRGPGGQWMNQGRFLITWDVWWGREFVDEPYRWTENGQERAAIFTHKAFQIRSNERFWLETRSNYASTPGDPSVGGTDFRGYGPPLRGDPVQRHGAMTLQPETWTRYWVELDHDGPETRQVTIRIWVADETTDPMLIAGPFLMEMLPRANAPGPRTTSFDIEFNTSQSRPQDPAILDALGIVDLVAYVRNLVVLEGVADPEVLMERPEPS